MIKIFLLLLFVTNSTFIYPQWVTQNSSTGRDLLALDMLNENIGYVCGYNVGGILKTTNSGLNWNNITVPYDDQYNSIAFCDNDTGLAVGPSNIILRTTNSGNSWNITYSGYGLALGDIFFVNKYLVYTCGRQWIYRSSDCGKTWVQLGWWPYTIFKSIYFTDTLNGLAVGTEGYMLSTTNGGINWSQRYMMLPVQFGDSSLYDVAFLNKNTGFACGNNGIFVKTTNAGVNWSFYSNGNINQLHCLSFVNENTGYTAGSGGRINKTTDGGISWSTQISPDITTLLGMEFINDNTGWICGPHGLILKTTNGGSTWISPISTETPSVYSLSQNYPNPFNPRTNIKFSISKSSDVKITVYDISGKELEVLVNEKLRTGTYHTEWNGANYSSGVYFYTMTAGDFTETKRILLVK